MIQNCYPHMVDEVGNLFKMETYLERVDLDKEREEDLKTGNGFIVTQHQNIKKDLKEPNGIFSTRFGTTLSDSNPFVEKCKCQCGYTMGTIHEGMTCPICQTEVKFIDDNFEYFGWIVLKDEYCVIHPNLYKEIEVIIGADKLKNIINPVDIKNEDGFSINDKVNKEEPYKGKGMIYFRDNFEEILEYYYNKSSNKRTKYDTYIDILSHKNIIFTHSIPVYTTLLRPFRLDGSNFAFNDVNGIFNIMVKLAHDINMDTLKIHRKKKPKMQLMFDLQTKWNKLYAEIENILSGKKGIFRQLFSGRLNFTSRDVIVPDDTLRVDEVKLSYFALVGLLEQRIINILTKSYNVSYNDAYNIWYNAGIKQDQRVYNIIMSIIESPEGVKILINRPKLVILMAWDYNFNTCIRLLWVLVQKCARQTSLIAGSC